MRKLRRVVSKTNGTGDGNRTRTTLRSQDFKSWASTNSATPARGIEINTGAGWFQKRLCYDSRRNGRGRLFIWNNMRGFCGSYLALD